MTGWSGKEYEYAGYAGYAEYEHGEARYSLEEVKMSS